jgi:hypothetical protein
VAAYGAAICPECGGNYKTGYKLRIHMISHSTVPYRCTLCTSVLKNVRSGEAHLGRYHVSEFTAARPNWITLLQEVTDPAEVGNFQHHYKQLKKCDICGKEYKKANQLKNHKESHELKMYA